MKYLCNITVLAVLIIALAGFTATYAQTTADVSAEVIAPANVIHLDDVSFGQIQQGATPVIDPTTGTGTGVLGTVSVGRFEVEAGTGTETDLIVNFDETVDLSGPGNDITFTSDLVGDADEANQATATAHTTGEQVTSDAVGNYYLWLGGTLGTIPISQDPGAYNGTFTITVTFP